jgi:hypothetical protein
MWKSNFHHNEATKAAQMSDILPRLRIVQFLGAFAKLQKRLLASDLRSSGILNGVVW